MKIHILFKFQNGPWGGGNQFLKALREKFIEFNVYTNSLEDADIILFNSYPFRAEYLFKQIYQLKRKYPKKIIIYRVDGPISLIRDRDVLIDRIIYLFNYIFSDGIIFQSQWSSNKNKQLFNIHSKNKTIIPNAPNNLIFNTSDKTELNRSKKINLIATSWSANINKGFDTYKYLDENLDFKKYNFTFIGNSPIKFKNIKYIKPLSSQKLARKLKKSDIFITASKNDPCSNSLIEALSCGLPAVVLNDGGHPELIKKGGEIFNTPKEAIEKINLVVKNYFDYKKRLPKYNIALISKSYLKFIRNIHINKKYFPKEITPSKKILFIYMNMLILRHKIQTALITITNIIWKK